MRLLLIEDDPRVADFVVKGLREAGHAVDHVADGREGLFLVAARDHDLVILDRMLPGVDGLTILGAMRAAGDPTPVMILSALGEVDDRVRGLKAGSDDYLTKPFAFSELLARIEVLARRGAAPAGESSLSIGPLEMGLESREVRVAGVRVDLTAREFRILEHLVRNQGRVVTRTMLLEKVWDYNFDPQTNIIDQHVSRLRHKLSPPGAPSIISTVRGVGYTIRAEA